MKIPVEYQLVSDGDIIIGFEPKVDIKNGLCIEHNMPIPVDAKMSMQPVLRHDLYAGVSKYQLPPRSVLDPMKIVEVYVEVPDEK